MCLRTTGIPSAQAFHELEPMICPRLRRNFAVAGVAVGIFLLSFWMYQAKYNPLHLKTEEEVRRMHVHRYRAPPAFWFLRTATVVLCPGLIFGVVTMDMGKGSKPGNVADRCSH